MSLTETLRWHARHRPAKIAIRERGKTTDYATLDATIDGLCYQLVSRGIARGHLVGPSDHPVSAHVERGALAIGSEERLGGRLLRGSGVLHG